MRILHMIPRYHPSVGGGQKHIQILSEELVRAGHEVTVLTTDAIDGQVIWNPHKSRIDEPETVLNGVRILRFPMRHLLQSKYTFPAIHRLLLIFSKVGIVPLSILNQLGQFIPWVPGLQKWLRVTREPFDIVGSFSLPYDSFMLGGQAFAKRRGIPYVAYALAHLGVPTDGQAVDPHGYFYTMRHQNAYIRRSDMLIANSADERDYYLGQGMEPGRIVVGGPGIYGGESAESDGDRFRRKYSIEEPIVLSIATMARVKGVMDTVEAVSQLYAAGTKVKLVLIGAVTDEFEQFWRDLPEAKRAAVLVCGMADEQEKHDALAAAQLFCMPSKTDSFGIVYLEAWLHKLPVIGANSWGVRRLITENEDGFLVPFGDVGALKARINQLLADDELAVRLGENGHTKVMRANLWEHKVKIVSEAYESLVTYQSQS